jgi:hypothetical protein
VLEQSARGKHGKVGTANGSLTASLAAIRSRGYNEHDNHIWTGLGGDENSAEKLGPIQLAKLSSRIFVKQFF